MSKPASPVEDAAAPAAGVLTVDGPSEAFTKGKYAEAFVAGDEVGDDLWGLGSDDERVGVPAVVNVGEAKVNGSMDADTALRTVRAHTDEVLECWNSPRLSTIELTLRVDDDGKVTASKASTIDPDIQDCIERAAGTWKFPKALAGSLKLTLGIEAASPPAP